MRITLVSYLNTRPFIDGLQHFFSSEEISIQPLPPSECAVSLLHKDAEMALIPVGSLLDFPNIHVLPNYCIGADGAVNSVFLFAQQPIESIENVLLDPHSRSSNGLTKVLIKHFWKKEVNYIVPTEKHFDAITGNTAGVVIGDKALKIREKYAYVYDLSEYWKKMTGLPFVFAVWAYYAEEVPAEILPRLDEAFEYGVLNRRESAISSAEEYGIELNHAINYLENDIKFHFTAARHEAMALYLKLLAAIQ
jgi:chorismate dehydratase